MGNQSSKQVVQADQLNQEKLFGQLARQILWAVKVENDRDDIDLFGLV